MIGQDPEVARAPKHWLAAELEQLDFPGFVVTRERDIFARAELFVVACDGALEVVEVAQAELERRMFDDGPRFIGAQLAAAAERIWSRWMAL